MAPLFREQLYLLSWMCLWYLGSFAVLVVVIATLIAFQEFLPKWVLAVFVGDLVYLHVYRVLGNAYKRRFED